MSTTISAMDSARAELTSFGEDSAGELYAVSQGGSIFKLAARSTDLSSLVLQSTSSELVTCNTRSQARRRRTLGACVPSAA